MMEFGEQFVMTVSLMLKQWSLVMHSASGMLCTVEVKCIILCEMHRIYA